jgi:hypothetical protein
MLPVLSNRWKTCASAVVVLTALGAPVFAQQPSTGTLHVTGIVRDAQTATPLRHARVTPVTTTSLPTPSFTDDDGRFSIDVAGNGTLKVAKAGYVEEIVKVARPAGTDPADLQVALKRGAAITGRVVDETGAPLQGARVVAWEMESLSSQGKALPTNDLGEFRVSGLRDGSFYVEATRSGAQERVNGRTLRNVIAVLPPPMRVRQGDSIDVGDIVIRTGPGTPASASAPSNLASDNTGSVAGRVRDTRGRPLKASVDLLQEGSETLATSSNEQGWFRFDRVAPGAYFAEVARPGAMKVRFGQRSLGQPGIPIDVRAGRAVNGIDFLLSAGAAISGTVSDEYGEPVEGARIRVLQIRRIGDRVAAMAPVSGPQWGTSDDRGRYRVFGLIPGRYLVVADGESSPMFVGEPRNTTGYAPIFYPNAKNAAFALPVTVGQADMSDIDIAFRPEAVARISGTIVNSRGQPTQGFVMLGVSQRSGGILLEPRMAPPTAEGTYVFENVPPGDYVVQAALLAGGGRTTEFARADVTVTGAEPVQVPLRASPGARVRGRITVDAQPSRRPPVIDIGLPAVDLDQSMMGGTSMGVPLDSDGSFEVASVTGPRRVVLLSPLDGWYVKAARVRGVEALDVPFDFGSEARNFDDLEVVVSPAAAAISGKVVGSAGEVRTDSAVVLFSSDSSKWYRQSQALRLERPSQSGEFRLGSLPPGSYYVVALSDVGDIVMSGDWQDPAMLDKLRSIATEVSVNESESRNVTLRLSAGQ